MNEQTSLIKELIERSQWLRKELFDMAIPIKKGHVPSSYSIAEVLNALYYGKILRHDPKNPQWEDRDRLIISKGHAAMAVYPILADQGYFSKDELAKFTRKEGILRQYADNSIPGVECVTGSLGHGLGIAAGFCIDAKRRGSSARTFVIMSDGEYYEGSVLESARIAAQYGLDNLVSVLDRNGLVILGKTENYMKQEPVDEQWRSFGWHVQRVNGHSYAELLGAFANIDAQKNGKPSILVVDTIKGKGLPTIEKEMYQQDNMYWHNKFPKPEQVSEFREQLNTNYITS